jgi:hypothetical protein
LASKTRHYQFYSGNLSAQTKVCLPNEAGYQLIFAKKLPLDFLVRDHFTSIGLL